MLRIIVFLTIVISSTSYAFTFENSTCRTIGTIDNSPLIVRSLQIGQLTKIDKGIAKQDGEWIQDSNSDQYTIVKLRAGDAVAQMAYRLVGDELHHTFVSDNGERTFRAIKPSSGDYLQVIISGSSLQSSTAYKISCEKDLF